MGRIKKRIRMYNYLERHKWLTWRQSPLYKAPVVNVRYICYIQKDNHSYESNYEYLT